LKTNTTFLASDKELVAAILNGDRIAFSQLIRNTEALVAHLAFKMIPVAADRKDVAQEVYLKVFQSIPSFQFQSKLSTWIGQIAYNTCLSYLKKKKPYLLESFSGQEDEVNGIEQLLNNQHNLENEIETQLFQEEVRRTLASAIEKLSPLYQTLVGLFYQQELPLSEISQITGLPEGTVKSYLFRARQELKHHLSKAQKREELR
jgi:RNA polymerase sigma factor (sigma-70 family)